MIKGQRSWPVYSMLFLLPFGLLLSPSHAEGAQVETYSLQGDVWQDYYVNKSGLQGTISIFEPGDKVLEPGNRIVFADFTVQLIFEKYHVQGTDVPFLYGPGPLGYPSIYANLYLVGQSAPSSLPALGIAYEDPWYVPGFNWWADALGTGGGFGYANAISATLVSVDPAPVPEPHSFLLLALPFGFAGALRIFRSRTLTPVSR